MGMTAAQLENEMSVGELIEHFADMTISNREQKAASDKAAAKAKTAAKPQPRRRGR